MSAPGHGGATRLDHLGAAICAALDADDPRDAAALEEWRDLLTLVEHARRVASNEGTFADRDVLAVAVATMDALARPTRSPSPAERAVAERHDATCPVAGGEPPPEAKGARYCTCQYEYGAADAPNATRPPADGALPAPWTRVLAAAQSSPTLFAVVRLGDARGWSIQETALTAAVELATALHRLETAYVERMWREPMPAIIVPAATGEGAPPEAAQ